MTIINDDIIDDDLTELCLFKLKCNDCGKIFYLDFDTPDEEVLDTKCPNCESANYDPY